VTFTNWSCIRKDNEIRVYEKGTYVGSYHFLKEPFCKICAHTDVETESCIDHFDLEGFERIYAMVLLREIMKPSDLIASGF
jgi:hypothetical protein